MARWRRGKLSRVCATLALPSSLCLSCLSPAKPASFYSISVTLLSLLLRHVPAPLLSGVEVPYQQLFALMTTLSALRMGLNCPWAADGGVALQPPKLSEHRGGSTAGGQHKCSAGNGLQKV